MRNRRAAEPSNTFHGKKNTDGKKIAGGKRDERSAASKPQSTLVALDDKASLAHGFFLAWTIFSFDVEMKTLLPSQPLHVHFIICAIAAILGVLLPSSKQIRQDIFSFLLFCDVYNDT